MVRRGQHVGDVPGARLVGAARRGRTPSSRAARTARRSPRRRGDRAATDGTPRDTAGCAARNAATRLAVADRRACAALGVVEPGGDRLGPAPVEDAAAHRHQIHHARWPDRRVVGGDVAPRDRGRCRRAPWCRWPARRPRPGRGAACANAHGVAMVESTTRRSSGATRARRATSRDQRARCPARGPAGW